MSCGLPIPGRGLAAGALSAVAAVLGVSSKVADQAATLLRGDRGPAATPTEPMPWDRPVPTPDAWEDEDDVGADEPEPATDTPWPDRVGVVVDDLGDTGAEATDDLLAVDLEPAAGTAPPERDAADLTDAVEAPDEPADLPVEPAPAADVTRVREPDTHAAELAARTAADVIAAVDRLSTDELGALYDEESRGKRRKTVLAAIEAALTP